MNFIWYHIVLPEICGLLPIYTLQFTVTLALWKGSRQFVSAYHYIEMLFNVKIDRKWDIDEEDSEIKLFYSAFLTTAALEFSKINLIPTVLGSTLFKFMEIKWSLRILKTFYPFSLNKSSRYVALY